MAIAGKAGAHRALFAAALVLSLPAFCATIFAAPLDGEACDKLKQQRTELANAGAEDNMTKGAAWAKTNLSPEKLDQIHRLIEVDEQIAFRCAQPKPTKAAAAAEPAAAAKAKRAPPEAGKSSDKDAADKPAPKVVKKAVTAAPKAAPDSGQSAAKAKDGAATAVAKPAAPKAVRPKANDAYTPPKSEAEPRSGPAQQ